jgi:hypothetical protein
MHPFVIDEVFFRGSMHFALSALCRMTTTPGPLGRAIAFRAFGAEDNVMRISD